MRGERKGIHDLARSAATGIMHSRYRNVNKELWSGVLWANLTRKTILVLGSVTPWGMPVHDLPARLLQAKQL